MEFQKRSKAIVLLSSWSGFFKNKNPPEHALRDFLLGEEEPKGKRKEFGAWSVAQNYCSNLSPFGQAIICFLTELDSLAPCYFASTIFFVDTNPSTSKR